MIEVVATLQIPREDEGKWDDRKYREGVLADLSAAIVDQIKNRVEVRRIRNVGNKSMKVEARLLVWERESAAGGRMAMTLQDAADAEEKRGIVLRPIVPTKKPTIEVATRIITMPDSKKEAGR